MRAVPVRHLRIALGAALLGLLVMTSPAAAMSLLPLDLTQLTDGAGRIFVGRVERVDVGHDAQGMPAVWTTFTIDQALKGPEDRHVTLKQLGTAFGGDQARILPHAGIPRYQPGEAVVLFVHPDSTLGFTSPVGLGQGCFRIHDRDGQRVVENDVGNRNLGVTVGSARALGGAGSAAPSAAEPLPLETLVGRVRARLDATP